MLLSYSTTGKDTVFSGADTTVNINGGSLLSGSGSNEKQPSLVFKEGVTVNLSGASLDQAALIKGAAEAGKETAVVFDGKGTTITVDKSNSDMRGFAVIDAYQTTLQNGATMTVTGDGQLNLAFDLPKGDPAAGPHYVADYTVSQALQNLSADTQGTFTVTSGAVLNVEKPNPEGKPYAAGDGQINLYNTNLAITDGGSVNVNGSILAQAVGTEGPTIAGIAMDHGKLTVKGDYRIGNMGYAGLVQVAHFQAKDSTISIQGRPGDGLGRDWIYTNPDDKGSQWDVAALVTESSSDKPVSFSGSILNLDAGTLYVEGSGDDATLSFNNSTVNMGGSNQVAAGIIYAQDVVTSLENSSITVAPQDEADKGYGIISANDVTLNNSSLTVSDNAQLDLVNMLPKNESGTTAGTVKLTAEEALNYLDNNSIESGSFTLTKGSAMTVAQNGTLNIHNVNTTIGDTATLTNHGTINIRNQGSLTLKDGSSTIVTAGSMINNSGRMTVANGARLTIADAVSGGTYEVVSSGGSISFNGNEYNAADSTGWKGENLQASSDMVILTSDDGMTFTAQGQDAHDVFTGLDDGMANAVNDLYTGHDGAAGEPRWDYANVDSADMGVRFLSRATDNHFLGADKDAAAATIESAARIAFAGAVPQMTKMASDAATNAVVNRLGFANPADGAQAMDAEGKIVDRNTTGFALWIAPLWQSQHGWGMEADNLDYGFNGNLGGVSLGADYTFENAIRAGITFNIGGGYAESSGGDLNSTENRMSFWGLGAYAGWNYENFGLMADVSYTSTWNDLKQDMDSRMGMGDLEADVQASAISAGLRAEYKLETSVLDVIPHIGVRYMSLNTWGFDAESNGGTVLEGDGFHQDIWTFPVGVTFTKDFTLDSGWSFKPSVDFSVIPAAGDIKAKQDVAFTGLPGSYEVETQMMDYLTWQGGVGLEMGNDTMSFGVNYTLQAGQHTTGHGVFGSFRYEF